MTPNINVIKHKVISIAWGHQFIESILSPVEKKLHMEFIHITHYDDVKALSNNPYYQGKLIDVPTEQEVNEAEIDMDLLASLEKGGTFTINNLIMSDRILRHLKREESLKYATVLARLLTSAFTNFKPLYVMGSWDSMIQGISMLVARKMGIPFYIMKFSVIPAQHLAICLYPNANMELDFTQQDDDVLIAKASDVLDKWRAKNIVAPAYISAKTYSDIIKMLPIHFREMKMRLMKKIFSKGNNRFLYYSSFNMIKQYIRKKSNILRMNKNLFITEVPKQPFFFYGLHMQPESSIDVMAPFYSDQYMVIESISRSMPVNYLLLVKIHVSDADSYSNAQIKRFLKIPGVRIVSPFVSSRNFIEQAVLLFSITGTIGLEGVLLGKPVIMFGNSPVLKFSSAAKVMTLEDIPALVNKKLADPLPDKEIIIKDYAKFLRSYLPSCSDDWGVTLSRGLTVEEENNFITIFDRLNVYAEQNQLTIQVKTALV